MEACFSGPAIALLGIVATAIQATIVALFVALMRSKDSQIAREQALNADLTEILRPSLGIANNALDKVRRDTSGKPVR